MIAAPYFIRELTCRSDITPELAIEPKALTRSLDSGYCLDAVELIPAGSAIRFDPIDDYCPTSFWRP